ncbi:MULTISPECIES: hypothetical protein [Pseudomonas]|uniref:Uncharacterized protein n=1 Tax=Pseudomonas quercus TaxID=2722792 RepID=A0ABX0YIV2_9PSED|nr:MULTISPECIES: hypothetical protein [Pseudomonas]MBF7144351.1 hypothetical protein [Pseudomonas sp. LY10J]NJP02890.1 hypothetical protein [Pseudomonas quercus]
MSTPGITPGIAHAPQSTEDDEEPSIHTPLQAGADIHAPGRSDDADITFKGRGGTNLSKLFSGKPVEATPVTEGVSLKAMAKAAKTDLNPSQSLKNALIENYGFTNSIELLDKGVKFKL